MSTEPKTTFETAGSDPAAIDALASDDATRRRTARGKLLELGEAAVQPLLEALATRGERARCEVLKVLGALGPTEGRAALEALVASLEDPSSDCRWVAAEALVAFEHVGLRRILVELTRYPDTDRMLRGAHHVLSGLQRAGYVRHVAPVLRAFASDIPEIELPKAALRELAALRP